MSEAGDADPTGHIFDFFKHLMTLSLVSIGGVFGLISGKNGAAITTPMIILIVGLLGLTGVFGLTGMTTITTAELKRQSIDADLLKRLLQYQHVATGLLSIGVGAFLFAFLKVLP